MGLEARSLESKCWPYWSILEALGKEESGPCLFLVVAGNPIYSLDCECMTSTVTPSFHVVFWLHVSMSPNDLLIRTSVIELRSIPIQYNLILTNYIFKDPFHNEVSLWGSW